MKRLIATGLGLALAGPALAGPVGYEVRRADMLAGLGYDAFAIDVFGAGNRPDTNEGRMAAIEAAFADPERLMALVEGELAVAREQSAARGRWSWATASAAR